MRLDSLKGTEPMKFATISIRAVIFAFKHGYIGEETLNHLSDNPDEIERQNNLILFKDKERHVAIQYLGDIDFAPVSSVIADGIGG
jgi:hypothetical protein